MRALRAKTSGAATAGGWPPSARSSASPTASRSRGPWARLYDV